jgi:hypothetical protein
VLSAKFSWVCAQKEIKKARFNELGPAIPIFLQTETYNYHSALDNSFVVLRVHSSGIAETVAPCPPFCNIESKEGPNAMSSIKYRHLGRDSAHRQALLRNLVTSLIEKESISTTWAKAKEAQRLAEKLITLGKKNTNASKQKAQAIFYVCLSSLYSGYYAL